MNIRSLFFCSALPTIMFWSISGFSADKNKTLSDLIGDISKNNSFIGDPISSAKCPDGFKRDDRLLRNIPPLRIGVGCKSIDGKNTWGEVNLISNNGKLIDMVLITNKFKNTCSQTSVSEIINNISGVKLADGGFNNITISLNGSEYDLSGGCVKGGKEGGIGIHSPAARVIRVSGEWCKQLDNFGLAKKYGCDLFKNLSDNGSSLIRVMREGGVSNSELIKQAEKFWDSEVGQFKEQIESKRATLTKKNQNLVDVILDKKTYSSMLAQSRNP